MKLQKISAAAAAVLSLALAGAHHGVAAPGPKGHTHAKFAAGTPGDPKKPVRVIEIIAKETDTGMAFEPTKIFVEQGEQIKFVIKNVGELNHEFMLDSFEANKKHAIEMQKNPEMEHDDPNGKRVESKQVVDLIWRFTKRGTFEYACLIPGHYESGMKGVVEVVAKGKLPMSLAVKPN